MFSVHGTKKLLDRVRQPVAPPVEDPTTTLGNWYATVLFWRPQLALLVNERTRFPVLMPFAPAASFLDRLPTWVWRTFVTAGVHADFVESEVAAMADARLAKTASRSLLGTMNSFTYDAVAYRDYGGVTDPIELALDLARTPCGPLFPGHGSPDLELAAVVGEWLAARA